MAGRESSTVDPGAGRPEPGRAATAVAALVLLLVVPVALLLVGGSLLLNASPTSGLAFVELDVEPIGSIEDGDGDVARTLQVDVPDDGGLVSTHLPGAMGHGLVLLVVVLAAVAALGVLRRRPAGTALVVGLLVIAVYAVATAYLAPSGYDAAVDRAIDLNGLPTTASQARTADLDHVVRAPDRSWFEWRAGFWVIASVCAGAASYVVHVRHACRRTGQRNPSPLG